MIGENRSSQPIRQLSSRLARLRRERLPYATMMANFYDGLLQTRLARGDERRRGAAKVYLHAAEDAARSSRVDPIRLAAGDALGALEGEELGRLREAMRQQRIAEPTLLERLYTLPLVDGSGGAGRGVFAS